MSNLKSALILLLSFISGLSAFNVKGQDQPKEADVKLFTPYMRVSVMPGESVDYQLTLINNTKEVKTADIIVTGIPAGWNYDLKAGGYNIRQLSVLPDTREIINLKVAVPLKVNKGTYRFQVAAGELSLLPLTILVSEQGTYKTEFSTTQSNMEGNANSTFTFQTTVRNRTAEVQHYSLASVAPPGWTVTFNPNYKPATSVDVEANSNADMTIEVDPPDVVEAGSYKIPVRAFTNTTYANLDLEVVIKGRFSMSLSTATGLVSSSITAGEEKSYELVISNTGTAPLGNVKFSSSTPVHWSVSFDPKEIRAVAPGASEKVTAKIKAYKRSIPGDYVTTIDATGSGVSSKIDMRMTVKTPLIWGWAGILVIILAIGSVYYLFRRYGRR